MAGVSASPSNRHPRKRYRRSPSIRTCSTDLLALALILNAVARGRREMTRLAILRDALTPGPTRPI
jgi:hypothetical protein